ncbi:MAG: HEAT repeat domain-containing protein [Cyanobacteria bacterium SIG26]|nr:HEAT repeat domain-containing protein [Cyanobacteria bacterium SIG26]
MIQSPYAPFNPCAVQTQPMYASAPQTQNPNYNAVKIDIHNPTVGTQAPQAQYQPATPVYTYPQAPIYTYPQAPVYPPIYPPVCPMPPQIPVQPPVVEVPPVDVSPVEVPTATATAPAVNTPAPVIVPPTITTTEPAAATPAPVATQPADVAPVQTPEIVPAETVAPQVDLNAFISKLANPDFETQAAGMEDIAKLVKEAPEKATELVDSKVFDALTNIVNFDSSALEGPTAEQVAAREKILAGKTDVTEAEKTLANTITPKELAERNKSYALFTSAIMQKLYSDEVTRLTNNTVPLTELPGIMTTIDNLKDNPSPMVRASAIEALSFIQNPAYKKDLTTVFTIAQNDSDQGVADSAKIALEKLNQI